MGKLIWLASYPKSGNTWARAFLHNYITDAKTPHSINNLTALTAIESSAQLFQPHITKPLQSLTNPEIQALRPKIHHHLTTLDTNKVLVKTHNANLALHNIPLCTPALTAGAIVIIRDPRDIAISHAAYTGHTITDTIAFMNAKGAANRTTQTQAFELLSTWSTHVASWSQSPTHLAIRYEDMLANPIQTFTKIIKFLGAEPNPARLARAIEFSNFATLSTQEKTGGYNAHTPTATTPFFRTGQSNQWRKILTPTQSARIETDHAEIMRRFRYV